ncbi:TPA: hypothetical protein HA241_01585 [Candidatus Woesearchaeota archaeon]|nr:hypothetical protein [Candidatus Woesearchaeota archaeon]
MVTITLDTRNIPGLKPPLVLVNGETADGIISAALLCGRLGKAKEKDAERVYIPKVEVKLFTECRRQENFQEVIADKLSLEDRVVFVLDLELRDCLLKGWNDHDLPIIQQLASAPYGVIWFDNNDQTKLNASKTAGFKVYFPAIKSNYPSCSSTSSYVQSFFNNPSLRDSYTHWLAAIADTEQFDSTLCTGRVKEPLLALQKVITYYNAQRNEPRFDETIGSLIRLLCCKKDEEEVWKDNRFSDPVLAGVIQQYEEAAQYAREPLWSTMTEIGDDGKEIAFGYCDPLLTTTEAFTALWNRFQTARGYVIAVGDPINTIKTFTPDHSPLDLVSFCHQYRGGGRERHGSYGLKCKVTLDSFPDILNILQEQLQKYTQP